jgi:hypothetical protein
MKFEYTHSKDSIVHGVLTYDTNPEEGKVRLLPNVPRNIIGLDMLSDWIVELHNEYKQLEKEIFNTRKESQ